LDYDKFLLDVKTLAPIFSGGTFVFNRPESNLVVSYDESSDCQGSTAHGNAKIFNLKTRKVIEEPTISGRARVNVEAKK